MTSLNTYEKDVYRLLRDPKFEQINPRDMMERINIARREVAMRCQCVRVLTNSSGAVASASVTAGGTGYLSPPLVTISPPDFPPGSGTFPNGKQATATASLSGTSVNTITVTDGGAGYFNPIVTISGGSGSGATATATTTPITTLSQGREVYNFSDINISSNPGAGPIYYVRDVSIIYANYRYSLPMYAFSVYQAKIRQYPFQYQYVPAFCSQFGQGTSGSLYLYPIASQTYQWELDLLCLPADLTSDTSTEIIPAPWTDSVKYFAAHLLYLDLQNFNAAAYYLKLFDEFAVRHSNYARIGRTINPYGRY